MIARSGPADNERWPPYMIRARELMVLSPDQPLKNKTLHELGIHNETGIFVVFIHCLLPPRDAEGDHDCTSGNFTPPARFHYRRFIRPALPEVILFRPFT